MAGSRLDRYQRSYEEGETIFEEGHVGDSVFLIGDGKVQVIKESAGVERVIATLSNGEVVGELALKDGRNPRSATYRATTDVEGWKLPNETLHTMIDKNETLRDKLISSLLNRISQTTDELSDAMDRDDSFVELSLVLMNLLNPSQWQNEDAHKKLEIDESQEFLAFRFGASLDVINDLLSLQGEFNFSELEPEQREKVFALSERIVEEGLERVRPFYGFDDEPDPELVRSTRLAQKHLDVLEDDSEILDRSDLQDIMEDRKSLKETLKKHQEQHRDDFIVNLLEMHLNSIDREINKRYSEAES